MSFASSCCRHCKLDVSPTHHVSAVPFIAFQEGRVWTEEENAALQEAMADAGNDAQRDWDAVAKHPALKKRTGVRIQTCATVTRGIDGKRTVQMQVNTCMTCISALVHISHHDLSITICLSILRGSACRQPAAKNGMRLCEVTQLPQPRRRRSAAPGQRPRTRRCWRQAWGKRA